MWNYVQRRVIVKVSTLFNANHPVSYSRFTTGYSQIFHQIHILLWRKSSRQRGLLRKRHLFFFAFVQKSDLVTNIIG